MHIGVDVGGTKTHLLGVADGIVRFDVTLATSAWRARIDADADAAALVAEILRQTAGAAPAILVVGSHGCDSDAECMALQQRLAAILPSVILVLNDSELLLPAAGRQDGICVISGTGSIAVSRDKAGAMMTSGGWGWFLGDEGSASGIVRDAARAIRGSLDRGEALDRLGQSLLAAIGISNPAEISHSLVEEGSAARIGRFSPLVFDAADAGSAIAQTVIDESGRALAETVLRLIERGAQGNIVVAGGGVITRQPRLMRAFSTTLSSMAPGWGIVLLREPPVTGAIVLAGRIARGEAIGRLPQPHADGKPQKERQRRAI
ncbi:N-acetylglucosamine kinase [Neorhizobium lilium]|uniref:N-acetylglucosamine kinase n=1 Tax=Neorhizobium lilium TaxID=2503024 RepID=A0A3S3RM45_9HYPH|nr:N-acetylglucosamine kinase [Neorhizobium lilium]